MSDFYNRIKEWLEPLGYIEVFNNHPLATIREYHFSKDGIRVVCVDSWEEYCYVYADIIVNPYNMGLRSSKFPIGTNELGDIHNFIYENSKKLRELNN